MNESIKLFIENNIEMIEQDKWDLFFDHAAEVLNNTVISDLIKVCQDADIFSWSNLTMIPDGAFMAVPIKQFDIPEHIKCIRHKAFAFTKLRDIYIPESVKEIQSYAFTGCYDLENVVISGAVYINPGAFSGCSSLRHVELPETLVVIEDNVFHGCTTKVDIDFLGTIDQWYKLTYNDPTNYFTRANIGTITCRDGVVKE